MDRREIRIVEQKNIVGVDAAVIFKPLDDSLDGKAGAGNMPAHRIARRQHVAVGEIKRRHVVVHLRRVYRAADAFQCRAHFLGDLVEPVRKNFESDRVDA